MNSNDIYYDPNLKGLYYNWYAANNAHGLCPEGWHVPSSDDWETLMKYVYENATTKSTTKALASREGWPSSNQEGTPGCQPEANNETGFSAFPVGWIDFIDYFDETGNCIYSTSQLSEYGGVAYFWSTYRDNYIGGNYYSIDFTKRDYTVGLNTEEHALSVRCRLQPLL